MPSTIQVDVWHLLGWGATKEQAEKMAGWNSVHTSQNESAKNDEA